MDLTGSLVKPPLPNHHNRTGRARWTHYLRTDLSNVPLIELIPARPTPSRSAPCMAGDRSAVRYRSSVLRVERVQQSARLLQCRSDRISEIGWLG